MSAPDRLAGQPLGSLLRAGAVLGLLVSASVHLVLAPGHLALSPLLGAGFLAAGVAQALAAFVLMLCTGRRVLVAAVLLSAALLAAYVLEATIGLPGVGHGALHAGSVKDAHPGAAAPAGDGLDFAALAAKSGELLTLIAGLILHHRSAGTLRGRAR